LTYHKNFKPPKEEGICDVDGTKLIQREDDTVEATKSLIREYEKDIDPILKEYKKRGVLEEIDASPSIPDIHREVLKVINSLNDEKKG
jgi:adenylate kinase